MLGRRLAGTTGTPCMTTLPQGTWAPWTATTGSTAIPGSGRTWASLTGPREPIRWMWPPLLELAMGRLVARLLAVRNICDKARLCRGPDADEGDTSVVVVARMVTMQSSPMKLPCCRPNHGIRMIDKPSPDISRLLLGRAFHKLVATKYPTTMADGSAAAEALIPGSRGRHQRVDLFLDVQGRDGTPIHVLIDTKSTDWDACVGHRVPEYLRRHARQLSRLLDSFMDLYGPEPPTIQGAIIYPRRPSDPKRAELVEDILLSQGISAVFFDELP
jgi:hypothetical protein